MEKLNSGPVARLVMQLHLEPELACGARMQELMARLDLAHTDGAWWFYLPALKLTEPQLQPSAAILAENGFAANYLEYVGNPRDSYLAQAFLLDEGRSNQFTGCVA